MPKEFDKAWRPDTRKRFERGTPFAPKTPFEAAVNFMKENRAHFTGDIYAAVSKHFKITPQELNTALANQATMPEPFVKRAVWDGYYHLTPDGVQLRRLIISHVPTEPMETRPATEFEALKDEYSAITKNHSTADATRFANCFIHGPGKTADLEVNAGGEYSAELLKRDSEIKKWIDEHKQKHPQLMELVRGVKSFTFPKLMRDVSAHEELMRIVGLADEPKDDNKFTGYVQKLFHSDNMRDLRDQSLGRHADQKVGDSRLPGILARIGADYIRKHGVDSTPTVSKRVGDAFRSGGIRRTLKIMDAIAEELKGEGIMIEVVRSEPMKIKLHEEGEPQEEEKPKLRSTGSGLEFRETEPLEEPKEPKEKSAPQYWWADAGADPQQLLGVVNVSAVATTAMGEMIRILGKKKRREKLEDWELDFVKANYHDTEASMDPNTQTKLRGELKFFLGAIAGKKQDSFENKEVFEERPVTEADRNEALWHLKVAEHPMIGPEVEGKQSVLRVLEDAFHNALREVLPGKVITRTNLVQMLKLAAQTKSRQAEDKEGNLLNLEPAKRNEYARDWPVDILANYLASPKYARRKQIDEERRKRSS